jgi:DNA adenine methylase
MPPQTAAPFLKWAGGKAQLLAAYRPLFAHEFHHYFEPFLGGGAVFFHLRPRLQGRVYLNDANAELVHLYTIVRDAVEELIAALAGHDRRHSPEHYYRVRATDPADLDPVQRAARTLYLNRTCYNGLYRVNRQGRFNVPLGRYARPRIVNPDRLRRAAAALAGVELMALDFRAAVRTAAAGDFVYFDPPYVPISATARFTSYTAGDFGPAEQVRLAEVFRELHHRGCRVMLSNADVPLVRELYQGFRLHEVAARRAVNARARGRGPVGELVVTNYSPE